MADQAPRSLGSPEFFPDALRRLFDYYPLFRGWLAGRARAQPHLAPEIEDAGWLAFRSACRRFDPTRGGNPATFIRRGLGRYRGWSRRCVRTTGSVRLTPPVSFDDDGVAPAVARPGPDAGDLLDLADALARLSREDRALLDLIYRDGLSNRVAAARLGCSHSTVGDRHRRILAELRRLMGGTVA